MSLLDQLKSEAAALEVEARAAGAPVSHGAALERVARRHGYANWRACVAILKGATAPAAARGDAPMTRYRSAEWGFELDVPSRWNAFPAVSGNSPFEVIRFMSQEAGGLQCLIVFRGPHDPSQKPGVRLEAVRRKLAEAAYSNFVDGETIVGSDKVATLDFDRPTPSGLWRCRHYFVVTDTLVHTLGFGATDPAAFDLFQRMAESFVAPASGIGGWTSGRTADGPPAGA